ncbi:MAG: hypothetical protein PSN37_04945 [Alphaproteobacteria bacterium]|nr:hypothetical protein [Alphaproteobacteria bacterium]
MLVNSKKTNCHDFPDGQFSGYLFHTYSILHFLPHANSLFRIVFLRGGGCVHADGAGRHDDFLTVIIDFKQVFSVWFLRCFVIFYHSMSGMSRENHFSLQPFTAVFFSGGQ